MRLGSRSSLPTRTKGQFVPDRHPKRVDHRQLSSTQSKRPKPPSAAFTCPEPYFFFGAAHVPVNSCTAPRRLGKITRQPEEVPYGRFGSDPPCYPPLSHESSRTEADDRRTRGIRAPYKWKYLTVYGEPLRALVHQKPLGRPTHRRPLSLVSLSFSSTLVIVLERTFCAS